MHKKGTNVLEFIKFNEIIHEENVMLEIEFAIEKMQLIQSKMCP